MGLTGQWGWAGLQGEETGVCQGEEKECVGGLGEPEVRCEGRSDKTND